MKLSMDRMISKLTGRRWQFIATFQYQCTPGRPDLGSFSMSTTFSVNERKLVGNSHYIKKTLAAEMVREIPRDMLTNGALVIDSLIYLGWYANTPTPNRTGKIGHKKKNLFP